MQRFSDLPWIAALLVHVVFATLSAIPFALVFGSVHLWRQRFGSWWLLIFPATQAAAEHLYPNLFPYYYGAPQYKTPWIWQTASLTGATGVTFLVLLVNGGFAQWFYTKREGSAPPKRLTDAIAALMALVVTFGAWRHASVEAQLAESPTVNVAIIQQNITMEERMSGSALQALKAWVDDTRELVSKSQDLAPDLVVWPEGSVPFNPNSEQTAAALGGKSPRQFFEAMAETGGFDLLIGGGTFEDPDEKGQVTAYNSSYLFQSSGGLSDRYDKMVLLPFGEYIPLADTFPFLKTR